MSSFLDVVGLTALFGTFLRTGPFKPAEEMPTMTRAQALERLHALLDKSGNQSSFRTCLWSEVRKDKKFLALGMPVFEGKIEDKEFDNHLGQMHVWFGQKFGINYVPFGGDNKEQKHQYLRNQEKV